MLRDRPPRRERVPRERSRELPLFALSRQKWKDWQTVLRFADFAISLTKEAKGKKIKGKNVRIHALNPQKRVDATFWYSQPKVK